MAPTLPDDPPSASEPYAAPSPAGSPTPAWKRRRPYAWAAAAFLVAGLAAIGVGVALHRPRVAPVLALDAIVDDTMTRHYGKYSDARKGWVYVDPQDGRSYLMQVIQRAKVAEASVEMSGYTAVYFLASGAPLDDAAGRAAQAQHSLVGLFVIEPDTRARDGSLVETAQPRYDVYGAPPLRADGVHFEALSADTYGWVFKIAQPVDDVPAAHFIDNVLLAPHAGAIVEMATFPAQADYRPAGACPGGGAVAGRGQPAPLGTPGQAAAPSSPARSAGPATMPGARVVEDVPPAEADAPDLVDGCSAATWSYKTGALPDDGGFVTISVTGGGVFNGERRPVKTWQLAFDPKSFSYPVPDDLQLF